MKTLHKYLTWQVLTSLLLTVAVFTFVLLLGNVLKEILTLLVNGQARIGLAIEAIGLLIPFVWVFALPMGLLTSTLLVFGRFSADQELTAARASGVSLISLVTPVLVLSLLCCGLSAWINMQLGPKSRVAYKDLIFRAKADLLSASIPAGRVIYDFPGYNIYTEKNVNNNLTNVTVWDLQNNTTVMSPHGRVELDTTNKVLTLRLFQATMATVRTNGTAVLQTFGELAKAINLNTTNSAPGQPKISDMTFRQLQHALRDWEKRPQIRTAQGGLKTSRIDLVEMERIRSAMHRQVAFSFACFGFALVGIPLGIRVHRRETNIGVAISLALVLVYYSFLIVGNALSGRPEFVPHLIFWLPNFIFQAVGAVLLWRANKGV
jgi:lipopolysaccharide export system permease protein